MRPRLLHCVLYIYIYYIIIIIIIIEVTKLATTQKKAKYISGSANGCESTTFELNTFSPFFTYLILTMI